LKYLLAFGFGGFPNLTSLSVDHAIPVFINGTGWFPLPVNINCNVSKIKISKNKFQKQNV